MEVKLLNVLQKMFGVGRLYNTDLYCVLFIYIAQIYTLYIYTVLYSYII